MSSVQPDILTERIVVRQLLEEGQLCSILDNVSSDSQCSHMINVLNRAMLNPAVGHSVEVVRALARSRELVQGFCEALHAKPRGRVPGQA
jgi:hypothetical protein